MKFFCEQLLIVLILINVVIIGTQQRCRGALPIYSSSGFSVWQLCCDLFLNPIRVQRWINWFWTFGWLLSIGLLSWNCISALLDMFQGAFHSKLIQCHLPFQIFLIMSLVSFVLKTLNHLNWYRFHVIFQRKLLSNTSKCSLCNDIGL